MTFVVIPPEVLTNLPHPVRQTIYTDSNALVRWVFWTRLRQLNRMLPEARRVLDFGCGEGALLPTLSRRYSEVTGVDMHTDSAGDICTAFHLENVRLVEGDAFRVKLPTDHFDLVTAADVLEHFQELGPALDLIWSLLKPGGCLAISGPTENGVYALGRSLFGYTKPADHYHTIDDIRAQVQKRFDLQRYAHAPFGLPWVSPFGLLLAKKR